jgi:tripartite-type tricarboxylate transporter receptor subunit TctC
MKRRDFVKAIAGSALFWPLSSRQTSAQAEQYPDHPVRVVVGYAAGGGPDVQARTVAQQLSLNLGQQVFVENRLGANGTIAARSVVQSKPDGYTLLFSSNGIAPTPYIYKNLGYDIFTDLIPIATIGILDGLFMLVDVKSPYETLQQFIDHAKKDHAVYHWFLGHVLRAGEDPPEIAEKLNLAVRAAVQAPAVASIMQRDGYVPDNRNVPETSAYFHREVELMGDAVKAAGI